MAGIGPQYGHDGRAAMALGRVPLEGDVCGLASSSQRPAEADVTVVSSRFGSVARPSTPTNRLHAIDGTGRQARLLRKSVHDTLRTHRARKAFD
jgi:hypothetical protein